MDSGLVNNMKKMLMIESIRQSLFDFFDESDLVYPPSIRDIQTQVPTIGNKVEVKPYIDDIDPTTNYVKLGWNLFVLGTNRMFLGYTIHDSIANMDCQIDDPLYNQSETHQSASDIINFIINTLENSKMGRPGGPSIYSSPPAYSSKLPSATGNSYYRKNKLQASNI